MTKYASGMVWERGRGGETALCGCLTPRVPDCGLTLRGFGFRSKQNLSRMAYGFCLMAGLLVP